MAGGKLNDNPVALTRTNKKQGESSMDQPKKKPDSIESMLRVIKKHLRFQTQSIYEMLARQVGRTEAEKSFQKYFPREEEQQTDE